VSSQNIPAILIVASASAERLLELLNKAEDE
jgi:hypothetical protein